MFHKITNGILAVSSLLIGGAVAFELYNWGTNKTENRLGSIESRLDSISDDLYGQKE